MNRRLNTYIVIKSDWWLPCLPSQTKLLIILIAYMKTGSPRISDWKSFVSGVLRFSCQGPQLAKRSEKGNGTWMRSRIISGKVSEDWNEFIWSERHKEKTVEEFL